MSATSAKQAEQESKGKKSRLYKCKDAQYVELGRHRSFRQGTRVVLLISYI